MGMYTESYIKCRLRKSTPQNVLQMLRLLASRDETDIPRMKEQAQVLAENEPFSDNRSNEWMRIFSGASAYFGDTDSYGELTINDDGTYSLRGLWNQKCIVTIFRFWTWIYQYIAAENGDLLGHWHYEEDARPVLIFYPIRPN